METVYRFTLSQVLSAALDVSTPGQPRNPDRAIARAHNATTERDRALWTAAAMLHARALTNPKSIDIAESEILRP